MTGWLSRLLCGLQVEPTTTEQMRALFSEESKLRVRYAKPVLHKHALLRDAKGNFLTRQFSVFWRKDAA